MPKTRSTSEAQIRRKRRELVQQMPPGGEMLKASLIERFTVCGRPGCRCQQGQKHGPYLYASLFDGKQSRQFTSPRLWKPRSANGPRTITGCPRSSSNSPR